MHRSWTKAYDLLNFVQHMQCLCIYIKYWNEPIWASVKEQNEFITLQESLVFKQVITRLTKKIRIEETLHSNAEIKIPSGTTQVHETNHGII